jgi:DnaJ-class molecular chaperone
MISRSTPRTYSSEYATCGNCHGTGDDGFGLMADGAPCEACDGRGSHKIDPNAKYIPFSEFLRLHDERSVCLGCVGVGELEAADGPDECQCCGRKMR